MGRKFPTHTTELGGKPGDPGDLADPVCKILKE
jgi:hypothetical protein